MMEAVGSPETWNKFHQSKGVKSQKTETFNVTAMRTHITASFVDFWDSLPHKEVIKSKR
jgi:hypothetical protein